MSVLCERLQKKKNSTMAHLMFCVLRVHKTSYSGIINDIHNQSTEFSIPLLFQGTLEYIHILSDYSRVHSLPFDGYAIYSRFWDEN